MDNDDIIEDIGERENNNGMVFESIDQGSDNVPPITEDVEHNSIGDVLDNGYHHRIICIGRSGSGKSVLMRWWGKRSPFAVYVNTQRNSLPGWRGVILDDWKEGLIKYRHVYINPPTDMDIDTFVKEYYEWALEHPGTMLLVDEASIWGARSKLSQSAWATTMITRSRTAFHSVISWHSSHQANNVLLMNADYICFFDSGQSMAIERDYLEKYFTPLVNDECMEHLKKNYHWVLYDVKKDEYRLSDPVPL